MENPAEMEPSYYFKVNFKTTSAFGIKKVGSNCKGWVLADNARDMEIEVSGYDRTGKKYPGVAVELYIDGILRNITNLRTGRGLEPNQFGELTVDRGVIMTETGEPIMKKFHFIDLDLDDAIINSRLVNDAGKVELRFVDTAQMADGEPSFDPLMPQQYNDRGAVSFLYGDLNNIVGIRFNEGDESLPDTKFVKLEAVLEKMDMRHRGSLGKTLSTFTFTYGGKDMLNHFAVIPSDHKLYDPEAAQRRFAKTRYDRSNMLGFEAAKNSVYTLCGSGILTRNLPLPSSGQKRRRSSTNNTTDSPKKRRVSFARTGKTEPPRTPTKAIKKEGLLTPGFSPMMNDIPSFPTELLIDSDESIAFIGEIQKNDVGEVSPIVVNTTHKCRPKCPVWQKIENGV